MSAPDEPSSDRQKAHDFRNSIGAIQTAAELLVRRIEPEGREKRLFTIILDEAKRLTALVDDTFGRPSR